MSCMKLFLTIQQNRLTDIVPILNALKMQHFKSALSSKNNQNTIELQVALIKCISLRRLKTDRDAAGQRLVALPERSEEIIFVELSDSERKLYDGIRDRTSKDMRKMLNVLRQFCICPSMLEENKIMPDEKFPAGSAKFQTLLGDLQNTLTQETDTKVLIFSSFEKTFKYLAPFLAKSGIGSLQYTGTVSNKPEVLKKFATGQSIRVLLITTKAGGVGLNLTCASHVYVMDPWWNPESVNQACDRVYRIGQTRPVFIKHIIARDTLDEAIQRLQQHKSHLIPLLFGQEQFNEDIHRPRTMIDCLDIDHGGTWLAKESL